MIIIQRMKPLSIAILMASLLYPSAPFAQEPLVVYNGRADQFMRPVVDRFTAETGIPVVLHAGSPTELLNKLRIEGARTEADLYISSDSGTLQIGENERLFHPLPAVATEVIPANYRGATWVGLSARARVLVVNTQAEGVDTLTSVFDLADPRWRGRVGMTSATNENFVAGMSAYQALAGDARVEAWLRGLRANVGSEVYPRHGSIVTDVANGRRAVGLVNHYYIYRHLDQHPDAPIRIVVPDQGADGMGVAWTLAGIAISRHTRKREAADAFVAFLVSEEGQRLFADANREYPTRAGLAADPTLPDAAAMKVADLPVGELATSRPATLDLIDKVGMP